MTALLFEDLGEEEYITEYPASAAAYLALKKARGKAHIEGKDWIIDKPAIIKLA